MAVDLDEQLKGQLSVIAQQGVADNQRLSMQSQLAFQKDLFQGAQGEIGAILASMNSADRTPIVKTG
jgi:hypothetical protein